MKHCFTGHALVRSIESTIVYTSLVLNYTGSESGEGPAYCFVGRLGQAQGVELLTAQSWQDWEQ